MISKNRLALGLFLLGWFALNMLQAGFTGLFNDEAYYWFYSRNLDWGFYDHPPLLALFIKAGSLVLAGEAGVRLLVVLLSLGTALVLRQLSGTKNDKVFFALYFSFLVFHITGFLAIPDSLLVFFTACFFLAYQRFRQSESYRDAIWLGIAMACLFYAKYLGVVIVFFTVVSSIRLLGSARFWTAALLCFLLLLPHLLWQYRHDFPSFYYHLLERSHDEMFRWSNFGDYLAGQAALVNPLLILPVITLLVIFKPGNAYERALKFSAIGNLLLPLALMVKGRVEANWSIAGLVPLFLITLAEVEKRPKWHRYLYALSVTTLVLVLPVRFLLIHNFLPTPYNEKIILETHGWKTTAAKIENLAEGRPVVFTGSYQYPSQYMFYTGNPAFAFNDALYRNNQYDLVPIGAGLQGQEVLVVFQRDAVTPDDRLQYGISLADSLELPTGGYLYYRVEEDFRSYNDLPLEILVRDIRIKAGLSAGIPIKLLNPGTSEITFPGDTWLTYYLFSFGKPVAYDTFEPLGGMRLEKEYLTRFTLEAPAEPGDYYLRVSLKSRWLPAGINSRIQKVTVLR